jgi:hypothetical protein
VPLDSLLATPLLSNAGNAALAVSGSGPVAVYPATGPRLRSRHHPRKPPTEASGRVAAALHR